MLLSKVTYISNAKTLDYEHKILENSNPLFIKLSKDIESFLTSTSYQQYVVKTWIYKNECLVVDFIYRSVRFAFDFIPLESTNIKVRIISRENEFSLCAFKNQKSHELCDNVSIITGILRANDTLEKIMIEIDSKFKFDVSIIIPIYNREKLVLPCIESLNSQSLDRSRFEIIFVDDNSSDRTVSSIDCHISSDINYRIIKRPVGSGNASTPRNEGIKSAEGKYLFFLDSDDRIDPLLLENGMTIANKNNSDIVYFKIVSDGDREVPLRPYKQKIVNDADIIEHHLLRSLTVFKFFRKSMLIENNILFNPLITVAEDKIFMVHALSVAERISILADRDYHTLSFHGEDHLSRRKFPLADRLFILINVLNTIYLSKKSDSEKSKLYNSWLIINLEMIEKLCRKNSIENTDFILFFKIITSGFKVRNELLNPELVYEKHRKYIEPFMNQDLPGFYSII